MKKYSEDKKIDKENRIEQEIRKGKPNVETLLNKPITLKNTIPASKLREISQKKLQEMISENHILALIIKDELAITMIGMEEFEEFKNEFEEQKNYIEHLEQKLEEMQMVNGLGEEYFRTPTTEFIELPDMTAEQYREWRKGLMR